MKRRDVLKSLAVAPAAVVVASEYKGVQSENAPRVFAGEVKAVHPREMFDTLQESFKPKDMYETLIIERPKGDGGSH
jgi:hypothetical protein